MTFRVRGSKPRQKTRFNTRVMSPITNMDSLRPGQANAQEDSTRQSQLHDDIEVQENKTSLSPRLQSEESADEEFWQDEPSSPVTLATKYLIPSMFTSLTPVRDLLKTKTSQDQDETVKVCLPFLTAQSSEFSYYNKHGVPHLLRCSHINFCHRQLEPLPGGFARADAARPWFFYWALTALSVLGEDVSHYRERLMSTVKPLQNETGGFGGGHGQYSHLATTYATVLSLGMVGGDAISIIDRKAMWQWLCNLKQPEGGFEMSIGGEVDVRGAYCAAMLIRLLKLPLDLPEGHPAKLKKDDNLFTRLGNYVSECQTYEGGIAGRPDAEAHGAYAFCALACLCILGDPHITIPQYLHLPSLISWLSSRQYGPEGGLAGRTNKLVDGCYSQWLGGCWPLVDAAIEGSDYRSILDGGESLYSREGLTRYILGCGQDTSKRGGLRDKPGMLSDGYHTCYLLAGLSSAQHRWSFQPAGDSKTSSVGWSFTKYPGNGGVQVFDEEDRVSPLHPVYVIPAKAAENMMAYCDDQEHFQSTSGERPKTCSNP